MTGAGIIFKMIAGQPLVVRYVHGEKGTFPAHVEPGEQLLIIDDPIFVDAGSGMRVPDPDRALGVLNAAIDGGKLRAILW
ncbi:hypothetical protein NKH54_22760 [Mesorhizobium sp. M1004]|uniref:hypothetical protein n=1 Tax=Mesorhizobium sp. M1004 TaxID=2957046 RepID=UPI0033364994